MTIGVGNAARGPKLAVSALGLGCAAFRVGTLLGPF